MLDFTNPANDPRKAEILDLVPMHQRGEGALTSEKDVKLLNRGWFTIYDKFDGVDYALDPGVVINIAYGAALHFRARAVVPGTRNPEIRKQESFFVIMHELGPDKREHWRMFTDEERAHIEGKLEAIARDELTSPNDREVRLVSTGRVAAMMPGAGASGAPHRPDLQADPRAGMPDLQETLSPPAYNEAQAQIRAATARGPGGRFIPPNAAMEDGGSEG